MLQLSTSPMTPRERMLFSAGLTFQANLTQYTRLGLKPQPLIDEFAWIVANVGAKRFGGGDA